MPYRQNAQGLWVEDLPQHPNIVRVIPPEAPVAPVQPAVPAAPPPAKKRRNLYAGVNPGAILPPPNPNIQVVWGNPYQHRIAPVPEGYPGFEEITDLTTRVQDRDCITKIDASPALLWGPRMGDPDMFCEGFHDGWCVGQLYVGRPYEGVPLYYKGGRGRLRGRIWRKINGGLGRLPLNRMHARPHPFFLRELSAEERAVINLKYGPTPELKKPKIEAVGRLGGIAFRRVQLAPAGIEWHNMQDRIIERLDPMEAPQPPGAAAREIPGRPWRLEGDDDAPAARVP